MTQSWTLLANWNPTSSSCIYTCKYAYMLDIWCHAGVQHIPINLFGILLWILSIVTLSILYNSKLLLSFVSMLSLCSQYSRLQPCSKFILGHMYLYLGKSEVKHYNMILFLPVDLKTKAVLFRSWSQLRKRSSFWTPFMQRAWAEASSTCQFWGYTQKTIWIRSRSYDLYILFGHVPMTFTLYSIWTCSYSLHILHWSDLYNIIF